jgi:alpha-amylase
MGVLLQAAYRQGHGNSVPSPADGNHINLWWWDHLADQAHALRLSGFTAVLLPPVLKTSAGSFPGAGGYGPFDDYNLGSKDQFFAVPTRFGNREQLQRYVAIMRANGLDVYVDVVPHQRNGGNNIEYRYQAAGGAGTGRFPKHKQCFFPHVPRDPIPGPVADDFGFGDELVPVNAKPPGYVMHGLIDAGDWMTRALDIQGYRIDDVKGLAVQFVRTWLNSKAMEGKFAVGEYFDGNLRTLNWWLWESGMSDRCNVFDFSLRFTLAAMCNNASRWDMAQLDHAGLTGISPANAVTAIENPDTDLSFPVVATKGLAYAYLLTSEGYPCVFYKDYSTDPGCYGLKPLIDNLIWIHENLAFGTTVTRFKDFQSTVYERQGHPNLLVESNNEAGRWRTLTVPTGFGPGVQLHHYTGHASDVWTDSQGAVTIGLPPNRDGTGYIAYSRTGFGQSFSAAAHRVTQTFEGADDLDIGPAENGRTVTVGRVWATASSVLDAALRPDTTHWTVDTRLEVTIKDPAGVPLVSQRWTGIAPAPSRLRATTRAAGWYVVEVASSGLPPPGRSPFTVTITYLSTQTLRGN